MRSRGWGVFREAAPTHLVTEDEEIVMIPISQETWQFLLLPLLKLKMKKPVILDQNICLVFRTRFSGEKGSLWRGDSMFGPIYGCILAADPGWECQMNSQTCGGPCNFLPSVS